MAARDFAILVFVCLVWAASNVLSKLVVGDWGVPPLFYAAVRFALVAAVTLPWLRPMPRPFWRLLLIGLGMGAGNFALLFIGLQTASPSAAAVVLQVGVPITTLLSFVLLGETLGGRRLLGTALTLAGAIAVMWNPGGFHLSTGLWFIAGAAATGSLGAVLMKQMEDVEPLRFQAWVSFVSLWPLALGTLLFEADHIEHAKSAGWPLVGAILFSALVVSVVAHTTYYRLIQRYEANLLAPLTLMTPLATITLGILITGDRFDLRMGIGTLLALAGVLLIARERTAPPCSTG